MHQLAATPPPLLVVIEVKWKIFGGRSMAMSPNQIAKHNPKFKAGVTVQAVSQYQVWERFGRSAMPRENTIRCALYVGFDKMWLLTSSSACVSGLRCVQGVRPVLYLLDLDNGIVSKKIVTSRFWRMSPFSRKPLHIVLEINEDGNAWIHFTGFKRKLQVLSISLAIEMKITHAWREDQMIWPAVAKTRLWLLWMRNDGSFVFPPLD